MHVHGHAAKLPVVHLRVCNFVGHTPVYHQAYMQYLCNSAWVNISMHRLVQSKQTRSPDHHSAMPDLQHEHHNMLPHDYAWNVVSVAGFEGWQSRASNAGPPCR